MKQATRQLLLDPLHLQNPITLQVLGICSALAITTTVETALLMCGALTFVLVCSNTIVSLIRNLIPGSVRIITQLAIISSLVMIADEILQAYFYSLAKELTVFVGLIVTNCIVMGRAEAFAMANPPLRSALDGLANSMGYNLVLIGVGLIRELFGTGKVLGYSIFPDGYEPNGLMVLSPGAFLIIGIFIWIQRSISPEMNEDS
ncbi:MAG TPA: NADH:ubiquinone reductase (Na(+)-transporting) subunit D [Planctomycetes bacterium]|nr:NADH:ubiquinone reductase (Na(+)-transporting) subunit D [Planctomycetota bacterium]